MELKEKVAYLKGLMEGMEYDVSTKEGKLMAAVVETLDAMAARVEEIDTDVDQLFDEVDAVSEDLEDVEDYLFDGEDGDEEDYADEYEAGDYLPQLRRSGVRRRGYACFRRPHLPQLRHKI